MILSHKYRFIFLKTRKTAGTSVEIALSRSLGDDDIITPISDEDEVTRREMGCRGPQNYLIPRDRYTLGDWAQLVFRRDAARFHRHGRADQAKPRIDPKVWDSYFKFCIERNPWDKAISLYYWRTAPDEVKPPLAEYLASAGRRSLSNFDIYSIDGRIVVDRVVRYESLAADLEEIRQQLGIPEPLELPKAKGGTRSDRRNYRDVLGESERRIIDEACSREIAALHYEY